MSKVKSSEIIDAMLSNLSEGAEEVYQMIAVPEIYWVYLHPEDFKEIERRSDKIVEEAKSALSDEIVRLNGALEIYDKGFVGKGVSKSHSILVHVSSVLSGKPGKRRKPSRRYAEPAKGWQVSINPDVEGICKPGDVLVKSLIGFGKGVELQGNKTMRLVTMRVDGKQNTHREVVDSQDTENIPTLLNNPSNGYAQISLVDAESGKRTTYTMKKSNFVIGRGGTAYWVDLPVLNNARVSQEHLKILRDETTGEFYIKDLSSNGTELNGARLPSSVEKTDGQTRETDVRTILPDNSRIVLADTVVLEFKILS